MSTDLQFLRLTGKFHNFGPTVLKLLTENVLFFLIKRDYIATSI